MSGRCADANDDRAVATDADRVATLLRRAGGGSTANAERDECEYEREDDGGTQVHARISRRAGTVGQVALRVPEGPLLTQAGAEEFWDRWPPISHNIDGQLRRQGVGCHDREDIGHDVALAALDAWLGGRIATSLEGWCSVVARNAAKRRGLRQSRDEPLEAAGSLQARVPLVEDLVQSRLEAEALGRVWPRLSSEDQALLIASKPLLADPTLRNRHYVALHRARKRARALVEAATLAWLGWSLAPRHRGQRAAITQLVAPMAVASVAVVAFSVAAEHPVAGAEVDVAASDSIDAGIATTKAAPAPLVDMGVRPIAPGTVAPRPRTPVRTPVEHREEVEVPSQQREDLYIENGDPAGEPLACAGAPPTAPVVCIDPL